MAKKYDDISIVSPYAEKIPLQKNGIKFYSVPTNPLNVAGRLKTIRELYEIASKLKADICHCHEPESLVAALKLKKRTGCKVIFDSHEMYSATLAQRFPRHLHKSIMYLYQLYEQPKIHRCDFVIGATWSISDYLSKSLDKNRTETILNCTLPDVFGAVPQSKPRKEIIICHDGSLLFLRGLKTMVKAINIVRKKYPVKFKIIGDVYNEEREWLVSYISKHDMKNMVVRTEWLDYEEVGRAMSECHIGLLALEKLPNHIIAAPNKIFNYMYFGMPFVAPDFCIDIKKLINEEHCGITADSSSSESYANAIMSLIESEEKFMEMSSNARKAAQSKYSWPVMERKLFNVYELLK